MTHKILMTSAVVFLAATGAFAKGHDQGQTDIPGAGVGEQTVAGAQGLGSAKGNRPDDKGPTNSPAVSNAGR